MNRIITRSKEMVKNEQVLYSGNHYLSVPIIDCQNGAIKNINVVSLSNKALVELKEELNLFTPHFYQEGKKIEIEKIVVSKEQYYLPRLDFFLKGGIRVIGRIFTDLKEKGLIYSFESSEEIDIFLFFDLKYVCLLRFDSHKIDTKKIIKKDKWLGNPVVNISSSGVSLALAIGGDKDFEVDGLKGKQTLNLKISCRNKNCFYIAVNYDPDGASATLIHLKRKRYSGIYNEFLDWLKEKTIPYPKDPALETRLNENLFFNYFYSIAKDMESDRYLALTSRSPRYYVSGAFWERDCFLWSADGKENFRLYNDPPGSLGTLCFYRFVDKDNTIFESTIDYYYSSLYSYYFENVKISELSGDHHPHAPSGLGLIISTDVFYPQVSRMIALRGVDIILSPVGIVGENNRALQVSGMWQEVQQNQFFAVESGLNGFLGERNFWGESMIHAPLVMTRRKNGFLARSSGQQSLIIAELDNEKRRKAISKFDVLSQLNREFYRQMKMFR